MPSSNNCYSIDLKGEELLLLPEKAIYWKRKKILLIADLHLGKAMHFRSKGIAVPQKASNKNWELLNHLIVQYQPKRVCFLGDLFHSTYNSEWEEFGRLIQNYSTVQFELIIGNHDILPEEKYKQVGFQLFEQLIESPFILSHEPMEDENETTYYNLAGHIHPAVRLRGKGRQSHRTACFYFGENLGLLPAFGVFTGSASLSIKKKDRVFIIVNDSVVAVQD